jgi:hypothetical protein
VHGWIIVVIRREHLFGPLQDVNARLYEGYRQALARALAS